MRDHSTNSEDREMKYQLIDESGHLIAEVKFNSSIHDDLIAVYLQDMCECVGAMGYAPVKEAA